MALLPERWLQLAWLDKAARTLLAVAPGLAWYVHSGDRLGVMGAFAALCLSVPYADRAWRVRQLACSAALGAMLLPVAVWLQEYPVLYVPAAAAGGAVHVLVQRAKLVPPRVAIWVLIYVLYASSELRGAPWQEVFGASVLVAPAALWAYAICVWLWPQRGAGTRAAPAAAEHAMGPVMHALCAGLAAALAAAVTFAFGLAHPNWAIWSALTVIRPTRGELTRRSLQRVAGMAIGCTAGIAAAELFAAHPAVLGATTAVAVIFMVAFEQYVVAVAVRSALAPLAALSLHDDALAAGEARVVCIVIGVAIGSAVTLALASARGEAVLRRALAWMGRRPGTH